MNDKEDKAEYQKRKNLQPATPGYANTAHTILVVITMLL